MIRLLLVDAFALIRQSLAFMLAQQPSLEVIGDVGSAAEAPHLATLYDVDLVIIEIELPEGDGVDLVRALRAAYPRLSVLVLTGTTNISRRTYAIEAGASTVLHRSVSYDELLNVIWQLGAIWRRDIGTWQEGSVNEQCLTDVVNGCILTATSSKLV